MKKFVAVLLAMLMLVPVFSVQSFAGVMDDFVGFEKDGLYYYPWTENEVMIEGYFPQEEGSEPEELVIPATVKSGRDTYEVIGLDYGAFENSNYSKITLPDTIRYIYDNAFWGCAMLEEVVIPETCQLVYFGSDVFTGAPAEGKFFEKDVNIIGENVLYSYTGSESTFTIPDYVTILAPACFMFSGVENVIFNENIVIIPENTFYGCRNLKEFEIPDSIETIGASAFKDCSNLEKVTLGENVMLVGAACFANTKIETIHLGASVTEAAGAFYSCNNLKNVTVDEDNEWYYTDENALYYYYEYDYEFDDFEYSGKDVYLEYYFGENTAESYTVKDDVTEIGNYAFYGCKTLKSIDLSNVSRVGMKSFAYSAIEEVDFGECYTIDESAFSGCKNLKEVDLSNVYSILTAAFENCTNLKDVTFSEEVYIIDGLAFSNTAVEKIEIYGDDVYIGEDAFKSCRNLKEVIFGDGVWFIESNVLRYCDNVETVYISKTVDEFGENAFQDCSHIKFLLIKGSDGYRFIKSLGYDFEIVGRLNFFESISEFFESIREFFFNLIFGM